MPAALRLAIFLLAGLVLAGCQSPYSQFFKEGGAGLKSDRIIYGGEPTRLVRGSENNQSGMMADLLNLFEHGYLYIGESAFGGPAQLANAEQAVAQGHKIGAAVAIAYGKSVGTQLSSVPVVSSTYATTYTRFGPISTSAFGTTFVPVSVERVEFHVLYYGKARQFGLGIFLLELSQDQRLKLGSNKGYVIGAVRKGSAAYEADVLPGDIVTAIDGSLPATREELIAGSRALEGRTVTLSLWRDGKRLTKQLYSSPPT